MKEQREATWSEYLVETITITEEAIEKVIRNVNYAEFNLLEILNKIESCKLFSMKRFVGELAVWESQDLLCLHEPLCEYNELINQIKKYNRNTIFNEQ